MCICLQTEALRLKIDEEKKEVWHKGLVCPKCGLILDTSGRNVGEEKFCSLCGFHGTFLNKNLWLCNGEQ
jgi:predicted RNA-binding Zn-ribbon protein involved in translation (DUF1610 family)